LCWSALLLGVGGMRVASCYAHVSVANHYR
jgi:hypothetical protein